MSTDTLTLPDAIYSDALRFNLNKYYLTNQSFFGNADRIN